jgi:undecaprenyl-diphosphatase
MSALEAIVLGVVQGLTEFLPISSSGHLRIVPAIFGWEDPGAAFTAVCQLGTMAAVLLYFRHDLLKVLKGWWAGLRDPELRGTLDSRMGWYLIIGTIPVGILGLIFSKQIEGPLRSLTVIAIAMIVFSIVMAVIDAQAKLKRDIEDLDTRSGLIIGVCQALALIPGVSRSGSTIVAGLYLGFTREAAARFSFLLSVPAVVLSGLFELRHVGDGDGASAGTVPTVIATIVAFGVGYASIAFLLKYLRTHTLAAFVVYRIAFATLVLGLVAAGAIS